MASPLFGITHNHALTLWWRGASLEPCDGVPLAALPSSWWLGDGHFTTMRWRQGLLENVDSHVERLRRQSRALGIAGAIAPPALWQENLGAYAGHLAVARVRASCYAAAAMGGLGSAGEGLLFLTIEAYAEEAGAALSLTPLANTLSPFFSALKSCSRQERLCQWRQARGVGSDDVLLYDKGDVILETTTAALFWVAQGAIGYPDPSLPLLASTSWALLHRQLVKEGHSPKAGLLTLEDLVKKDVLLYSINSLRDIRPVASVAAHRLARCPTTDASLVGTWNRALQRPSLTEA